MENFNVRARGVFTCYLSKNLTMILFLCVKRKSNNIKKNRRPYGYNARISTFSNSLAHNRKLKVSIEGTMTRSEICRSSSTERGNKKRGERDCGSERSIEERKCKMSEEAFDHQTGP